MTFDVTLILYFAAALAFRKVSVSTFQWQNKTCMHVCYFLVKFEVKKMSDYACVFFFFLLKGLKCRASCQVADKRSGDSFLWSSPSRFVCQSGQIMTSDT